MLYTEGPGCAMGASGHAVAAALQFFAAAQCLLSEPWPVPTRVLNGSHFDFIVVGGGAAGATVAARLSELPASVLLLEAGADPPADAVVPGYGMSIMSSPYDWNFTSWAGPGISGGLDRHVQRQPRGRMLGGTTSLNDLVYARGFPQDYNEWAETLGKPWQWDTVLEFFKKTENLTDERIIKDPELMKYHSMKGEINVAGFIQSNPDTDFFLKAFNDIGFETVKDMTNPDKIGVGRFSHTIRDGTRASSLTALLNKAAKRDNLSVLTDAMVTKILIKDKTAYGVNVTMGNRHFIFFADKEVVVAAGAYNTPKLLMLSGIGPKGHLESKGIDVVENLPVGENLQDHTMVQLWVSTKPGTCTAPESEKNRDIMQYLYDRTGPLGRSNSVGAYLSLKGTKLPDFAYFPICIEQNRPYFYEACKEILGYENRICEQLQKENQNRELMPIAVVLLKPKSRGRVSLKSADPLDYPDIFSGIFSDEDDLIDFPAAMEKVYKLIETPSFKEKDARMVKLDIPECDNSKDKDYVRCYAKSIGLGAWHTCGTAAAGPLSPSGVAGEGEGAEGAERRVGAVDARLRVYSVGGLRVADASAMPSVVRGNINAPVVMMAERAADFIKHDHYPDLEV